MRQRISLCAGLLAAVLLCGCGESKEAKEARLSGIERMAEGDYGGAIASFEEALEASDGIVDRFELDILKYRGEAEYLARDYAAAAYTYGTLEQVEGERAEYRYYKAAAEAMAAILRRRRRITRRRRDYQRYRIRARRPRHRLR